MDLAEDAESALDPRIQVILGALSRLEFWPARCIAEKSQPRSFGFYTCASRLCFFVGLPFSERPQYLTPPGTLSHFAFTFLPSRAYERDALSEIHGIIDRAFVEARCIVRVIYHAKR